MGNLIVISNMSYLSLGYAYKHGNEDINAANVLGLVRDIVTVYGKTEVLIYQIHIFEMTFFPLYWTFRIQVIISFFRLQRKTKLQETKVLCTANHLSIIRNLVPVVFSTKATEMSKKYLTILATMINFCSTIFEKALYLQPMLNSYLLMVSLILEIKP